MQEQRYYSSKNDPWNICLVHFYGSVLNQFLAERGFHRFTLWNVQHVPTLEKAHEQLLEEVEKSSFLQLFQLSTLTYTFLIEFFTNVVPRTSDRRQELDDGFKLYCQ